MQHSTPEPAARPIRSVLGAAIAATTLSLAACSGDSGGDGDPIGGAPGDSLFADSSIADERFADVTERQADPDVDESVRAAVVDAFNDFSLDVHRRLGADAPGNNAISSGYSLATAISLLRAGASGSVDTTFANLTRVADVAEADLHEAINAIASDLDGRSNEDVLLRTANRLFTHPDRSLSDPFMNIAVGQYGAPATEIDFRENNAEAIVLINRWVSAQTDGLIPALLSELSPETQAMVVNAILLDALWDQRFQERGDRPFRLLDGTTRDVESFGDTRTLAAFQDDELSAVEIPYEGGDIAMLVMLPDSLEAFEATLDRARLDEVRASLERVTVDLTLPKWTAETRFAPQVLLAPAGFPEGSLPLDDLFDDDPPGELYVLNTVHQAIIEVDEIGTRAAAATAIGAGATSIPDIDLTITIDRPFAYVLIDRPSGLVLFAGRTVVP